MDAEKIASRIKTKRKIFIITIIILLIGTFPCDSSNSAGRYTAPSVLSLGAGICENDPLSLYFTVKMNDTAFFFDIHSLKTVRRLEKVCTNLIPPSVTRTAKRIVCRK